MMNMPRVTKSIPCWSWSTSGLVSTSAADFNAIFSSQATTIGSLFSCRMGISVVAIMMDAYRFRLGIIDMR